MPSACRYEIALIASDGLDEAEFILQGDKGEQLIGMPLLRVIGKDFPCSVSPPPEFIAVILKRYSFIVSVSERIFFTDRPSFSVIAIEASHALPPQYP